MLSMTSGADENRNSSMKKDKITANEFRGQKWSKVLHQLGNLC